VWPPRTSPRLHVPGPAEAIHIPGKAGPPMGVP